MCHKALHFAELLFLLAYLKGWAFSFKMCVFSRLSDKNLQNNK
jgi:hypothetical protein